MNAHCAQDVPHQSEVGVILAIAVENAGRQKNRTRFLGTFFRAKNLLDQIEVEQELVGDGENGQPVLGQLREWNFATY